MPLQGQGQLYVLNHSGTQHLWYKCGVGATAYSVPLPVAALHGTTASGTARQPVLLEAARQACLLRPIHAALNLVKDRVYSRRVLLYNC